VIETVRTLTTAGYSRTIVRRSVISLPLAVVLVFAVLVSAERRADASPRPKTCSLSALHFTLQPNGGLGHGWYRVLVQNVGSSTCSPTGYPRVRVPLDDHVDRTVQRSFQRVMPPGSFAPVNDTLDSYAGGYSGPRTKSGRVALPLTDLIPRSGAASFTIEWAETSLKACPISLVLELGLTGSPQLRIRHQFNFVCSSVEVTPFVRGNTGFGR
jgi:hypothetical protein